tara:strand:- start:435 stop:1172 length:738 start_codon:yes stop_codon:yes gene_type:complete
VLFSNFWIWRLLEYNALLGALIIVTSTLLYLLLKKNSKHYLYIFLPLFILVLFFQWQTTAKTSLSYLDKGELGTQEMRLRQYPLVSIQIRGKTTWIPLAHWFEGRKESITFFRIQKNFSEIIDPNLYFFANHPRERVGIKEFEKFSYVLLPFFVIGMVSILQRHMAKTIFFVLAIPIVLISLIGHKNSLGPFALFPFFVVSIAQGLKLALGKLQAISKVRTIQILLVSMFTLAIILVQLVAYVSY